MYDFKYIYTKKITEDDYFPYTILSFKTYQKMSTPVPVPNHWLGFSYICSKYYELDLNIYGNKIK